MVILLLFCIIPGGVFSSVENPVFSFQKDGIFDNESTQEWAKLNNEMPELAKATICTWLKIHFHRYENTVWTYCIEDEDSNLICSGLVLEEFRIVLTVSGLVTRINVSDTYKLHQWNSLCFTIRTLDFNAMYLSIYFNGRFLSKKRRLPGLPGLNKWLSNGVFILGQDQDTLGGDFERQQSFSGAVAAIDIWDYILSPNEIQKYAKCQGQMTGNILPWAQSNWTLNGDVIHKSLINLNELCKEVEAENYVVFPKRQSLSTSRKVCLKLGGELSLPRSLADNKEVLENTQSFHNVCNVQDQGGKVAWLGLIPDGQGQWLEARQNQKPNFTNWRIGKEIDNEDNCAFLLSSGKWSSTTCSQQSPRRLCAVCQMNSKIKYFLRGLCHESKHDRVFFLEKSKDENKGQMPYFKGLSSSIMSYDEENRTWILKHLRYKDVIGYLADDSVDGTPIGRKSWIINDSSCPRDYANQSFSLTLTKCNESQFTCNDGSCLEDLGLRCDLKPDCLDQSDEFNCHRVVIDETNYEIDQPPRVAKLDGTILENETLPVILNIDIKGFDKINTIEMTLSVIMKLTLKWRDRRLDFLNLRHNFYQNSINNPKIRSKIWIPEIGLANAKTGQLEKDDYSALLVSRESQANNFSATQALENLMYPGYSNSLVYIRRYQAEYQCMFDLRPFPFDRQECTLLFKMRSATKQQVVLTPGSLIFQGPKTQVEFVIEDLWLTNGNENATRSEVALHIRMSRSYLFHITQTFFQSFLLAFLAYLTFWIDIEDFNDRFIGSLTALLVLASLMSSLTGGLPNTAYYKVVDVWLIFFVVTNAVIITLHIIIDILIRKDKAGDKVRCLSPKIINNLAKILFPILFVLFVSSLTLSICFRFAIAKPLVK